MDTTAGVGGRRETRDSWSLHLLADLGQDLGVPEQGVLLLADLDGAATELYSNRVSIKLQSG